MGTEREQEWTRVIGAEHGLLDLRLREAWGYRYLVFMFVRRDWVVSYEQTLLGPLWNVVQPILSSVIYTFVFGKLAGIGTDGVPPVLFYFTGNMLWTYFTRCVMSGAHTFIDNQNIFSKVYFPRLCVPIANAIGFAIRLLIQFLCLCAFYFYYIVRGARVVPSVLGVFLLPILLFWIGACGMGMGLIFSALTTKYRDLNNLLSFALPLAMYATPVVYPLSEAPSKWLWLFLANPLSAPLELFRSCFFGTGDIAAGMCAVSIAETAALVFLGLVLFTRNERTFVDVI